MKRLKISIVILLFTIVSGIAGYCIIEDMTLFESLYMTIITISSVGFMEVKPLSVQGRALTMFIIILGITNGAYALGTFIRMFVEGELRKTFGRKKMEKNIESLTGHYIICGYGRIGSLISRELRENGKKFVVIENDPAALDKLEKDGYYFIRSDAVDEDSLIKAGILKAKAIVTAVRSDSDNVFITLTAKGLNPDIFILSRASDEKNEVKLKRAGASSVVSPYLMGGKRMAQLLISPTVVDFIDIAVSKGTLGLRMDEVKISPRSDLIGKNLIESNLRKNFGVIIVLIKKFNGDMIFNPSPTEVLESKDVLVILGKEENMKKMSSVL